MRIDHWLFLATAAATCASTGVSAQSEQPAAALPSQINGAINAQAARNANGRRYEDHRVRFEAARRYRVSVLTSSFDPIVQVLRPDSAEPLVEDDDNGPGLNARAIFVPPASGDYVIRALSFLPEGSGAYRLYVEEALPLPPPLPTQPPADRAADRTVWTAYPGTLAETDPSLDGIRFDDYLVTLAAGEEMFVRLDATAFDPILQIRRPSQREGEYMAADDDSGGNRNAMLLLTAPSAGDYIVRVTAFSPTHTRGYLGEYRLRIGR